MEMPNLRAYHSEQLIKALQKRYGYSKDKAEAELDTTYAKAMLG
jgi:uncharacterized protein YjbJ (UPF0337 family)